MAFLDHVKCRDGFNKVVVIVDEDASARRRCDRENLARRIPCGEIGRAEVELGGPELGIDVPQSYGVVATARYKVVCTGVDR